MCIPTRRLAHLSLDCESLGSLLPEILPPFLLKQRWFGARSSPIRSVTVVDVIPIPDTDVEVSDALVKVVSMDGSEAVYQLVLGIADPRAIPDRFALAHLELPARTVCLYDVLGNASDCERILQALQRRSLLAASLARVRIDWTPALDALVPPFRARPIDTEQSNSSVVFGKGAILKMFRRIEPGINPDVELTRFLTAAGFAQCPRYLGEIAYVTPQGASATLAGIQQYVANEGDGWADARTRIRAYLDDPSQGRLLGDAAVIQDLGVTTARLHLALASLSSDSAFAPEPITHADLARWRLATLDALRRVASAVRNPDLLLCIPAVESLLDAFASIQHPGCKQRLHGDFHLGQVLRAEGGWLIFDFEGEPTRPLGDRRDKHSPLRDVAGMLRSLDYAAVSVLFERSKPATTIWQQFEPLAFAWEHAARHAFLQGWSDVMRAAPSMASDATANAVMLDVLEIDKAIYELAYELAHRPDWLHIPLHGMERIISRRRV